MLFILEFINSIPPFCAFGIVSCLVVMALTLTLCDRYEDEDKALCTKVCKYAVIIGVLLGLIACFTPRAQVVALDWTTKLVKQGEMTPAEQKQIMEMFHKEEKK